MFFRFDVINNNGSYYFNYFEVLNIRNYKDEDLDYPGIKHITESIGDSDITQVIEWQLDDPEHYEYIHEMFVYTWNVCIYIKQ
jgi:hypothetical protein